MRVEKKPVNLSTPTFFRNLVENLLKKHGKMTWEELCHELSNTVYTDSLGYKLQSTLSTLISTGKIEIEFSGEKTYYVYKNQK